MLKSNAAQASYSQLQRHNIAGTICRGTSGDDFNFFYSDEPYWSDNCLGWVPHVAGKSMICASCLFGANRKRKIFLKTHNNEIAKELGDGNRVSRQPAKPGESRRSQSIRLCKGRKHSSKCDKNAAKVKNKKTKNDTVQKSKKRDKK